MTGLVLDSLLPGFISFTCEPMIASNKKDTADCEMFMGLNSGNCEWLVGPSVGISEFASTLNRNLELLCERPTTLINKEPFQENMNNLSTFLAKLEKFDSKQRK